MCVCALCVQECKKRGRPFCPVCQRHFKTPRKFVEHMKSVKHKQQVRGRPGSEGPRWASAWPSGSLTHPFMQVHLQEQQEEELITLDAIGCFQEEEEELREEGGRGEVPKISCVQSCRPFL